MPPAVDFALDDGMTVTAALARTVDLYMNGPLFPAPPAIDMVACGTARYAALAGAYFFKRFAHLPVRVFAAGEYRCDPPLPVPGALTLGISQSGETADTLFAPEMAKRRGLDPDKPRNLAKSVTVE